MKFRFDPNQDYQIEAIAAVAELLAGRGLIEVAPSFELGSAPGTVANRLDLSQSSLLTNLQAVQQANGIPPDDKLEEIDETIETAAGTETVTFPNFSVEMETGTGKTYVYIRTALELFRRYGLRKFIIVVPSVAIREGVFKELQITATQFGEIYGNVPYRYYIYDSTNLTQVRQFALSDSVELMVMTIDSFNKASNVIRQSTDRLQGETPIHLVQSTRPVLILDEPQNMESELRVRALAALNPLFALRYSATHRNPYNLTYRLTPFEAYRQGLVKRIEVASVVKEDDENQAFVRLERIDANKKTITARLTLHQLMKTGAVKEKTITVRYGDSLEDKAGRSEYAGFEVDEINAGGSFVRFANNLELRTGESRGAERDAIFEAQIRYTVEEHFRKQRRLRDEGIKVLSLFFIDRVANYADDNGIIRRVFNEAFNELKKGYDEWKDIEPESVQAAYFAEKRRRGGSVELLDSTSGETKADEAAYDLIMRHKERLLSFEEPVAFIFSHSALREGWDNPNVFQICTLNQTVSEIKKRQEVGRGVRLCRDQDGERVQDERINVLTVVANESYERYVAKLQAEIEDDYGPEGTPPKPPSARKRGVAKLRKNFLLKPEFKELWEQIKHKTRYSVSVDTAKLVDSVVPDLDKLHISPPRVAITKAEIRVASDEYEAFQVTGSKLALDLSGRYPLPNLVDLMANLMEHTAPPVKLTRRTLLEMFKRTTNKAAAVSNPQEFATEAVRIIKERAADHLCEGIKYEKINEWYEMGLLEAEVPSWEQYLVPAPHSVYDQVIFDSQVERDFVEGLEKRKDVLLYLKLPAWFKVPTPVGEYNPDWAIVMDDLDAHGDPTGAPRLYLVRETKGEAWKTSLRPAERRKITCGERHFEQALGVDYDVVTTADQLP